MYGLFVLLPLVLTVSYSFFKWNGVTAAKWVGASNYVTVLSDPSLFGSILNSLRLIVFFSFIPVGLGLIVASVIHRVATGRLGTVARTVLFLPQVIPLVAAGIIWSWLLAGPGLVNELLDAVGLGALTRAWLGDFATALPAVGLIGVWVLLGFCVVLLLTGMSKIDAGLYESARIDGAGWFTELRSDHAAQPPLRDRGVPHGHGHRRVGGLRHRVRVHRWWSRQRHRGSGHPDLWTRLHGPPRSGSRPPLQWSLVILVLLIILPIQRLSREGRTMRISTQ